MVGGPSHESVEQCTVSVGLQSEMKGKGNVPGGWEAVGSILGILTVWSMSAKFEEWAITTHVHGPPAMSGPVVWHENRRSRTLIFNCVCLARSTAF